MDDSNDKSRGKQKELVSKNRSKSKGPKLVEFHNSYAALAENLDALDNVDDVVDWLESRMFRPFYEQLWENSLGPEWKQYHESGSTKPKLRGHDFNAITDKIDEGEAFGRRKFSRDSREKALDMPSWTSLDHLAEFVLTCTAANSVDRDGIFFRNKRPMLERRWGIYQAMMHCKSNLAASKSGGKCVITNAARGNRSGKKRPSNHGERDVAHKRLSLSGMGIEGTIDPGAVDTGETPRFYNQQQSRTLSSNFDAIRPSSGTTLPDGGATKTLSGHSSSGSEDIHGKTSDTASNLVMPTVEERNGETSS